MCGPLEMFASRKNGSGDADSLTAFRTVAASPSSGGGGAAAAPSEEVYQWTPVGAADMVDGGAGKVYAYDCTNDRRWAVSFGPFGTVAGMSGGWRNGPGGDSPAVFRTGAASRGTAVVSGGPIRGGTVNAAPCADIV